MAQTIVARLARIERALETLAAERTAPAPAIAAPKATKAASPFVVAMRERAAAKVACDIHGADRCNRSFSPKSSGRENHVARLV